MSEVSDITVGILKEILREYPDDMPVLLMDGFSELPFYFGGIGTKEHTLYNKRGKELTVQTLFFETGDEC